MNGKFKVCVGSGWWQNGNKEKMLVGDSRMVRPRGAKTGGDVRGNEIKIEKIKWD